MSIKLHKRFFLVRQASLELSDYVVDWTKKHDLTAVEALRIVLEIAHDMTRYLLREERHPNSDKKADEE